MDLIDCHFLESWLEFGGEKEGDMDNMTSIFHLGFPEGKFQP
jgi:hypothetical protein